MYDTRDSGGAATNNLDKVMARFDHGEFDLLGVGRAHLANPDFAHRIREGLPLDALEPAHLKELV